MAFTFEDYRKLNRIFDLLQQTVVILGNLFPTEYDLVLFNNQLSLFKDQHLQPFVEYFIERDIEATIPHNFPFDLETLGNDCFARMDAISENIYLFIEDKNCGHLLRSLNNQNFF